MNVSSGSLKELAKQRLADHWGLAVFVSLLASIIGGGSVNFSSGYRTYTNIKDDISPSLQSILGAIGVAAIVWFIAAIVIGAAVQLGVCVFYTKLCRSETTRLDDLFSRFSYLPKAFALRFMIGLFTFLWSLLFIIPGIIAAYRYSMAFYIMADNPEIGIMDAINESKRIMAGHKMDLFVLSLSFLGWALLSILTCGIGFLFLTPYMETATAAFYLRISHKMK